MRGRPIYGIYTISAIGRHAAGPSVASTAPTQDTSAESLFTSGTFGLLFLYALGLEYRLLFQTN